jgi:hypothetical protein
MSQFTPGRVALVAPVFLYALLVTFLPLAGVTWVVISAAALTALPVLGPLAGRRAGLLTLPAFLLFLDVGVSAIIAGGYPGGVASDVAAGLLLGSPLWFLGVVAMSERELGVSLLAVQLGLAQAAALLSTRSMLLPGIGGHSPRGFGLAYVNVLTAQLNGLAQLIRGTPPGAFPLQRVIDPLFLLLAAAALLGIVLAELGSRTAERARREASERVEKPWRPEGRHAPLALPDQLESILRGRSRPEVPAVAYLGELAAVAVAVLVVLLFELAAAEVPSWALLGVATGAAVVLGLLIVLSAVRRDRLEPAHPSATSP